MCGWGKKIAYIRFVWDGTALCWLLAENLESGTAASAIELQTALGPECNEDKWVSFGSWMALKVEAVTNAGTVNSVQISSQEVGLLFFTYISVHYFGLQATLSIYWIVWVCKAVYCLGPWIWHWFHFLDSLTLTTKWRAIQYKSEYCLFIYVTIPYKLSQGIR